MRNLPPYSAIIYQVNYSWRNKWMRHWMQCFSTIAILWNVIISTNHGIGTDKHTFLGEYPYRNTLLQDYHIGLDFSNTMWSRYNAFDPCFDGPRYNGTGLKLIRATECHDLRTESPSLAKRHTTLIETGCSALIREWPAMYNIFQKPKDALNQLEAHIGLVHFRPHNTPKQHQTREGVALCHPGKSRRACPNFEKCYIQISYL